jgi:hypothetical protein
MTYAHRSRVSEPDRATVECEGTVRQVERNTSEVFLPGQAQMVHAGVKGLVTRSGWDSFCVYGVKLHPFCATNRVPISYELTPANVAEVGLVQELLAEANLRDEFARELLGISPTGADG